MKWIAAAVLAGCLVIALAIVTSQPDPPTPDPTSFDDIDLPEPRTEALCMADNGVWVVSDFGVGACQGEDH